MKKIHKATEALEAGLSYRATAEKFGIPLSTLHGMVNRDGHSDKRRYLTMHEESMLSDFAVGMGMIGMPISATHVSAYIC